MRAVDPCMKSFVTLVVGDVGLDTAAERRCAFRHIDCGTTPPSGRQTAGE
jgi:hypothetical protein